ncbi:MAG: peptide-methionine (S)-S-oxide reductase MsrA [Desulfobacteraceae bacterium]|jgi:peptide methionine sulfoxide reductase msrA/msrB
MVKKDIHLEIATFAGGCFWCVESEFGKCKGIEDATSGYCGGHTKNPTYEEVCSGRSGHLEAVQLKFDPVILPYDQLLEIFWQQVDPTDPDGQFVDRGSQYRTAIFFHDDHQRRVAEASKLKLSQSGYFDKPIATEIIPFNIFYPAESYHQGYCKKNPLRYKFYRRNSGRDQFLKKIWEDYSLKNCNPK